MNDTAEYLRTRIPFTPRVFVILGSGLGALADQVEGPTTLPFGNVPGLTPPTVEGHTGRLVAGHIEQTPVLFMQGRMHLYEGHPPEAIAVPVRAAAQLGVKTMIVTNAAGGINHNFQPGDLMLIDDHINLMWQNPLTGPAQAGEPRFPDLSEPYDRGLQRLAQQTALELGVRLQRGTYLAASGPSYETRAEIRMFERMGADAIGMSTVPEVIAAKANGMRVLGISLITNLAAGTTPHALSHAEVMETAAAASKLFGQLIRAIIARL